ncbi:MAG: LamG domain-containing protein [Candidatus Pacebacteria bacterium]|nr:LamG domain-containing protein [Candidatus Paceibacterota bacterium]
MIKQKSFTLIELLVVIVIIGVIAGVIMVTVSSSVSNATFARAKAFSSNVQNSMLLNLVSEWTFDEGNANDSWGVNDGTLHSTTTPIVYWDKSSKKCVFGGCYEFNGDDYIDCGNVLSTANSYTFSFWGKITDLLNNKGILGFSGTSSNVGFSKIASNLLLFMNTGNYRYWNASDNKVIDNIENDWHFFTLVVTGFGLTDIDNAKLYIDGNLMIIGSLSHSNLPMEVNNFLIGKNTYGNYLGLLDDVRIYNAILSSSQIKQNYIAGLNSMLANGNISKEEYNQRISKLAQE